MVHYVTSNRASLLEIWFCEVLVAVMLQESSKFIHLILGFLFQIGLRREIDHTRLSFLTRNLDLLHSLFCTVARHDVNLVFLARWACEATVPYEFKLALFRTFVIFIRNDHSREIIDRLIAVWITLEFHMGFIALLRVTKALIALIINNIVATAVIKIEWPNHVDLAAKIL